MDIIFIVKITVEKIVQIESTDKEKEKNNIKQRVKWSDKQKASKRRQRKMKQSGKSSSALKTVCKISRRSPL